jgi:hypothetical protein
LLGGENLVNHDALRMPVLGLGVKVVHGGGLANCLSLHVAADM